MTSRSRAKSRVARPVGALDGRHLLAQRLTAGDQSEELGVELA